MPGQRALRPSLCVASGNILLSAQVTDNSGAKIVKCIQPSGTQWTIGDIITVAVQTARGGKVGDDP